MIRTSEVVQLASRAGFREPPGMLWNKLLAFARFAEAEALSRIARPEHIEEMQARDRVASEAKRCEKHGQELINTVSPAPLPGSNEILARIDLPRTVIQGDTLIISIVVGE